MIRPAIRPSPDAIERYRRVRAEMEPTFLTPGVRPPGFHDTEVGVDLGHGEEVLDRARIAIEGWRVHSGSGVDVTPSNEGPRVGATVGLATCQFGMWVVMACRITAVFDDDHTTGFTYATLPGHPECGEETFLVRRAVDDAVRFDITATWRSDAVIARLAAPLARVLQGRATQAYLDAMVRAIS